MIYDSTLIDAQYDRTDIQAFPIPATQMALDNELQGLANIIVLGQTLYAKPFCSFEVLCEAVKKCVPPKKSHLLEPNLRALRLGYEYRA